jgi:uncharacterized damage-inducible protein DinB
MAVSDAPPPAEAWLRGPLSGVDPFLMPCAHSLVQCREDLARAIDGLTPDLMRARPGGAASITFHLAHIAGTLDRLLTYARGEALSEAQRAAARREKDEAPGSDAASLLAEVSAAVEAALAQLRATHRETLLDPRPVGRAALPSNVLGLLAHASEHALRHAGQVITTAKVLRNQSRGT